MSSTEHDVKINIFWIPTILHYSSGLLYYWFDHLKCNKKITAIENKNHSQNIQPIYLFMYYACVCKMKHNNTLKGEQV